jgi:hypothetical protein
VFVDVAGGVFVDVGARVGVLVGFGVFVGIAAAVLVGDGDVDGVGVAGGAFGSGPGGFWARYFSVSAAVTPNRQSATVYIFRSQA